jgi:subtilisin family serine protease
MLRVTRTRSIVCGLVVLILIIPRGGLFAATADSSRKIVTFVDSISLTDQLAIVTNPLLGCNKNTTCKVQILHELSFINALAVQYPNADPLTLIQIVLSLLSNLKVVDVSDDSIAIKDQETSLTNESNTPNGAWFGWGEDDDVLYPHIKIPPAYNKGIRGSGVTVAVLDTGIDFTHPNLAANIATLGGFDAIAGGSYEDDNGHGTLNAGIIAATPYKGRGLIGTASEADLVAVKVLDQTGRGYLSDLLNGLQWVHNKIISGTGRWVLNMSLSFAQGSVPLQKAIDSLYKKNAILVASAGNCGQDHGGVDESGGEDGGGAASACNLSQPAQNAVLYPAAYSQVMAVAATDILNNVSKYSRYGPQVAVTAPGGALESAGTPVCGDTQQSGRLLSTARNGDYAGGSGTSFAAAHASGVVALTLQCQPSLSFDQVVARLRATAHFNPCYPPERQGAGLIDAAQLIQELQPCAKK